MYNFSVIENEFEGVEVGRVLFEFIESNRLFCIRLFVYIVEFVIDENKSIIMIKRMFDCERNSFYFLIVVIIDGRVVMNVIVFVKVEDINDNVFIFVGLENSYNLILFGVFFVGEIVLRFWVIDRDFGVNGFVKFFIVSGNKDWVFYLNKCIGKIMFNKEFSRKLYILIIRVVDLGDVENEVYLWLIILVRYIIFLLLFLSFFGDGFINDDGEVELWIGIVGFFLDFKMIIIVGVCVGFVIFLIFFVVVFILKFRCKDKRWEDKCGSYYELDISWEDVLKVFKKMF